MYTLFPMKNPSNPSISLSANDRQQIFQTRDDTSKNIQRLVGSGKSRINAAPSMLWPTPSKMPEVVSVPLRLAKSKLTSRPATSSLASHNSTVSLDIISGLSCTTDFSKGLVPGRLFESNGSNGRDATVRSNNRYRLLGSETSQLLSPGSQDLHSIAFSDDAWMQRNSGPLTSLLSTSHLLTSKEQAPSGQVGHSLFESLSQAFSEISLPDTNSPEGRYPVVKLSNIPWTVSIDEIQDILPQIQLPDTLEHAQSIHILIDRSTGKTLGDAYIELARQADVTKLFREFRHPRLRGRRLSLKSSSQDELMSSLFPKWQGTFTAGRATLSMSSLIEYNGDQHYKLPPLVTASEYESLLAICRDYRGHFSRKCGERPFENFISLLVKYPFHETTVTTTLQRDHLYEYYKLATKALKRHLSAANHRLQYELLFRMMRAAVQCPHFTIPQKKAILAAGEVECPADIAYLLVPPPEEEVSEEQ